MGTGNWKELEKLNERNNGTPLALAFALAQANETARIEFAPSLDFDSVPSRSITKATILIEEKTTAEEVNRLMQKHAAEDLAGILEYSIKPLVSSDILGNHHSCIFDSELTKVNQNLIRIFGWYDNEVGYSSRMVDLIHKLNS